MFGQTLWASMETSLVLLGLMFFFQCDSDKNKYLNVPTYCNGLAVSLGTFWIPGQGRL